MEALAIRDLVMKQKREPIPGELPRVIFKSKYGLQKIDYSKAAPADFWSNWPVVTWEMAKSMDNGINVAKLRELAMETKYPDVRKLELVCDVLSHGAKLGVAEHCQVASTSSNAMSAIECGEEVTDVLYDWLVSGFVMGPMKKEDIPFTKIT